MSSSKLRAVVGTVAAVGAVSMIVLGSASAAPTTKFVSKQYRYSVVLPGSSGLWHQSAASMAWTQGTLEPGVPQFDTLTDARTVLVLGRSRRDRRRRRSRTGRLFHGVLLVERLLGCAVPQRVRCCPKLVPLLVK
jgi:hypothetical protein